MSSRTELLAKIQEWLNEKPFTREANLGFWSGGIVIVFRQQSQTVDKIEFRLAWEQVLQSNLDLVALRIDEAIQKMRGHETNRPLTGFEIEDICDEDD